MRTSPFDSRCRRQRSTSTPDCQHSTFNIFLGWTKSTHEAQNMRETDLGSSSVTLCVPPACTNKVPSLLPLFPRTSSFHWTTKKLGTLHFTQTLYTLFSPKILQNVQCVHAGRSAPFFYANVFCRTRERPHSLKANSRHRCRLVLCVGVVLFSDPSLAWRISRCR